MKYKLHYWFEYGGGMLWADPHDAYTQTKYFSCVEPEDLPISESLIQELHELEAEFQGSLDWSYPPGPSPWSKELFHAFYTKAGIALAKLQEQLKEDYEIADKIKRIGIDA